MLSKLKAWYRNWRLEAAKRVLVKHYEGMAAAQGLYSPSQRHKFMLNGMSTIADAACCVTSTLTFEQALAAAKPNEFVKVDTDGKPFPDFVLVTRLTATAELQRAYARLYGVSPPSTGSIGSAIVTRSATDAELKAQAASFARAELAFGSDADEARDRAAWRARQPKGDHSL